MNCRCHCHRKTLNEFCQSGRCQCPRSCEHCQKSESPVTPKLSDCKYCYGKGYYTVASGGNITYGDFLGDAPYNVPLTIEKHPCPRCTDKEGNLCKPMQPESQSVQSESKPSAPDIEDDRNSGKKRMCLCGDEVTPELQAKIDKEFKNIPGGPPDNKPSTEEHNIDTTFDEIWDTLDDYHYIPDDRYDDPPQHLEYSIKQFLQIMLQKERERIAGICETVKRDDRAYFNAFQRGYHKGIEKVKQQILNDSKE